jgi:Flp pilus assembly protein TadB
LYISVFAFITLLCIGVCSYIVRNPLAEAFEGVAAGEAVEKKNIIAQSVDLIGSLAAALPVVIKNLISLPDLPEVLKIAGWKISSEEFLGVRVLASVSLAGVLTVLFGRVWLLGTVIGAILGFVIPVSILAQKVNAIGFNLQHATPLFLKLLIVGIRGGQSVEEALVWAGKVDDDLSGEIQRVMTDIKGSMTLQEAMAELAWRAEIMEGGELAAACENISLSHKYGAEGISVALENVVRDMEARRGYQINNRIKKLENIITVPLVLSAMLVAVTSMAAPYLITLYGGASSVFMGK